MSTAAVKNFPAAPGNPAQSGGRKSRTPLSVVRSVPRKRRAPFVVLCFGLLAVALVAVLVLNISVSTAQYQLVELRARQSTLTKQNQDLTQQVQNYEAPQNLAAKAKDLGMVASTVKGQIDLSTLAVTGKATPAVKGASEGAVIPAPAVPGQSIVVPPVPGGNTQAGKPADGSAKAPAAAAPAAQAPAAAAAPSAAELNGGTVPAPQQKVPGQ